MAKTKEAASTQATHTPGPWTIEPAARPGHIHKIKSKGVGFIGVGSPVVGGDLDEQEANARLIAAAPDLLVELKAVEWSGETDKDCIPIQCPRCGGSRYTGHSGSCSLAAALARAEGR